MILDYSEFVSQTHVASPSLDPRPKLIYVEKWCPFCRLALKSVFFEDEVESFMGPGEGSGTLKIAYECACGFWQTYVQHYRDHWDGYHCTEHLWRNAILKRFSTNGLNAPLSAVRHAVLKRQDILSDLHSKKVEALVGAVFSDFFDCAVKLVGRTGDNGIDLFLVSAEQTTLVQVKRRERNSHKSKAEPVSTVREFLGAVQLSRGKHAILVTTADHFTRPARNAAETAIELNLVKSFDLVDGGELLRRLKLTTPASQAHWRRHVSV